MARVAAFLRRHRRETPVVTKIGFCQINLSARSVTRGGDPLELTPKEFGLLEYFLNRPCRALTRDQILNAVWGLDTFVTDRSVDRAVTLLRRKIEENPHRPKFIRTVQKIGYRFEPEG